MNSKYIILGAIFLATMIGGRMVLATSQGDNKILDDHPASQELNHADDDDHDDNDNDTHVEEKYDDDHDDHNEEVEAEGGDEDDHDEESGIVEMTRAQQEEIGLVVINAHSGDIEDILSLVGEVRLNEDRMAHLVPKVSGIVSSVPVSLGEKVQEGQALAIIDSPEFAEFKADYLEKLRNFELTRATFERKQYLKQEKIASEADWLEAQSAFQIAKTTLLSAKRRLIVLNLSEKEILGLPNAEDEAFGQNILKSPITGTIIAKHITRGEKISDEEVFTVADLSDVWVDLQIPAKDVGRVQKGLSVEISSTEGEIADGKLILIGPVADPESRTFLGRVELQNPKNSWRPGVFVRGLIHGKTSSAAVVVPSEAVQNIDGENIIFVPEEDGFQPVDVTLGKTVGGKTEILAGLKHGERYVAKGAFDLKAVMVTSGAGGHAGHGH